MQSDIEESIIENNSDELNYIATNIFQTLIELEKEWEKDAFYKKTLLLDSRVLYVMELRDKWIDLFMKWKNSLSA